ncbi:MAG: hypothetical protein WCS37_19685, partial [Chloroflexota bacterium]
NSLYSDLWRLCSLNWGLGVSPKIGAAAPKKFFLGVGEDQLAEQHPTEAGWGKINWRSSILQKPGRVRSTGGAASYHPIPQKPGRGRSTGGAASHPTEAG